MKRDDLLKDLTLKFNNAVFDERHFKNETTVELDSKEVLTILAYIKSQGFDVLIDLTAVDYLTPIAKTKIVYWLHNFTTHERIRIVTFIKRNESIDSVTSLWEGADWYERELFDMFGVHFNKHPDLKRILMPDDWHGHPMLKDYSLTEVPVQFKHDVKPKVPSEIIHYVKSNCK